MNDISDNTRKSDPTTKPKLRKNSFSCLGCFGCSTKNTENRNNKVSFGDQEKDRWRFSWLGLRRKKLEMTEKVNSCKQVHAENKIGRKSHVPVTGEIEMKPETLGLSSQDKPLKKRHKLAQGKKERCKSFDRKSSSATEISHLSLWFDKKERAKNDETTLLESLEEGCNPSQNTATLSNSSPLSLQRMRKKKETIKGEKDRDQERNQKPQEGEKLIANSESIYELSILMVTLTIMIVWGKLCAIVCTSTWLYLIPHLKRATVSVENRSNQLQSDLLNKSYKKKVVLDGFLERNHRNVSRIV